METKQWQPGLIIYFGIFVLFSPLILRFYNDIPARSWNFFLMGAAAIALAVMAMKQRTSWPSLANIILGAWIIISPWIVGFSRIIDARNTALVTGLLIALVSLWAYSERPTSVAAELYGARREEV